MTSSKSSKQIYSLDILKTKLRIIVLSALLFLSLLSLLAHPQEAKVAKNIHITSPVGGIFDLDDRLHITGTANLATKQYLWLIVKQIKSGSTKLVYLDELKVDSVTNAWEYSIVLDKLEGQYDFISLPSLGDGRTAIDAKSILLKIMAIIVNDAQHKKLKSHLIDKLKGVDKQLVPPSIISKDKVEITVKYN
jgi:hypothetical protein